jgi:hypothetical protein
MRYLALNELLHPESAGLLALGIGRRAALFYLHAVPSYAIMLVHCKGDAT